jgi:hypothetical protein
MTEELTFQLVARDRATGASVSFPLTPEEADRIIVLAEGLPDPGDVDDPDDVEEPDDRDDV